MAPPVMLPSLSVGGVPKPELLARLLRAGVRLNPLADALFADLRFVPAPTASRVALARVSVASLGLPDGGTFAELVAQATARGLALCPMELGPHLRLAFTDQPEGAVGQAATVHRAPPGAITVASAPLCEDDDVPKGFYLRRIEGTLWLRGYTAGPEHVWRPEDELVFVEERHAE
ncbi:MAG: hypothetical protein U0324_07885 [Polyangiales bacterium]